MKAEGLNSANLEKDNKMQGHGMTADVVNTWPSAAVTGLILWGSSRKKIA